MTVAVFALGLGAFFLGMCVRRKSQNPSIEREDYDGDQPELEGEAVYTQNLTAEMDDYYPTAKIPDMKILSKPPTATTELVQPLAVFVSGGRTE